MSENLKTGTTTVGLKCKNCIILGADKRATAGHMIVNKNVDKVQSITDNMALTTSGSVSDIQLLIKLIKAELKLKDIKSNRESSVKEAANLMANMVYSNVRQFFPGVTHFLLGGYDGEYKLFDLFPDGTVTDIDDFVASGSGSVFAYGVLEDSYEKNLSKKKGVELAKKAINSALKRDSASGNGMDIYAITKDGVEEVFSKKVKTHVE